MRDFKLFYGGLEEPEASSSSNPEFLDLIMVPGTFNTAIIKFQSGVPFLAHARKLPREPEEIRVRMGVLERVFVRGQEPRQLSTPSKPGPEFAEVPNLLLYLGQRGVRGLSRTHALLFHSGEISISFKSEEMYAMQRHNLTPGKVVRQAMEMYDDVFLKQFANC